MALTRKFLAALGIEDGKIDEIISAHTDTVNGLKEELDKYRDDAGKYADTQKKLDEANQKLSEVEAGDAKDKWKVKYDALKEEFDGYKESISAEKTRQARKRFFFPVAAFDNEVKVTPSFLWSGSAAGRNGY